MNAEMLKLCGFWRDKNGDLTSSLGDFKLIIKSNDKKTSSSQPELLLYITKSASADKIYNSNALKKARKATKHDDYCSLKSGLKINHLDEILF